VAVATTELTSPSVIVMRVIELEAAWVAVHDALPAGWTVHRPSRHIEDAERPWHVFAVDLRVRAKRREYVEATGWTEAEALADLAELLRGRNVEDAADAGGS
jgi:hypothetical protein